MCSGRYASAMNRSPASALEVLGIAHAIVGVTKFRRQLRGILSDGVFNGVGKDPQRATALWFLMVAPRSGSAATCYAALSPTPTSEHNS